MKRFLRILFTLAFIVVVPWPRPGGPIKWVCHKVGQTTFCEAVIIVTPPGK